MTTPPYHIRRARADDQATIRALVHGEHLDPMTLDWPNFLVAEGDGGRVVGIGQIKPLRGARELGSLVVVPDWRERGVGAALIHALMADEPGPLFLVCRERRVPYYRKFGFREIGLGETQGALRVKAALMRAAGLVGLRGAVMRWDRPAV
jgi:amino-acid N-acetyltransferase